MHPLPIYSLILSSVFSRQQGLLGGAEAIFLSSNQKLISTEISDKQTNQAEAEFEKSRINDSGKFNNEGIAHGL